VPKLVNTGDAGLQVHKIGGSNFTFQAARIGSLGATEYTLVTIAVDTTGSTDGFTNQLREMLIKAVDACKKSPRKEFLLIRVLVFSTLYPNGHQELHGFVPVLEINTANYPTFVASGATPLWDATYAGVGALAEYGGELAANDFNANGILFVITDGVEGDWSGRPVSTTTPKMIADKFAEITKTEVLESLVSILIGINAESCRDKLEDFRREAGFTQYIDAGDATEGSLAKLAAFVSQSVSSQSQAIGTGGPSQNISATI
jgi:hypothetical protein